MISLELSMVQQKRIESEQLAQETLAFLSSGGEIEFLESGIVRPDSITMQYNTPRGPASGKTESMNRLRIIPDIEEARAKKARKARSGIEKSRELALVERIKAMRDTGVTRRQATKHLEIGNTLFFRLITDYAIDYPKSVNGRK